ncbi:GntR family transcriptional regulator [Phaeobacter italicus]|jgi:DNA-binding GntR family transcriptional regulator|uniref:GntR family transcriptional regulator n=1 Tax=Phaeobacter italicus TaxID=481446 RepID=UPI002FD95F5A
MISRTILSEQIRDTLLDRILGGQYQQGDRLVESQLAKEFGVSQSPVREALRDLVAMHFVELEAFKGARVRRIDPSEIAQVYPVRAALEELAGQLAAPFLKGNVNELEVIYRDMVKAAETGNMKELTHLDAQFHRTIIEATQNRVLSELWDSLMIESRTYVTTVTVILEKTGLMSVVEMHRPLIDVLNSGNPHAAGQEMKKHVSTFAKMLEKGKEDVSETN